MTMEARFLTSSDYAALVKETDLALVPLGAVEVYGPHLPMGADGIATEALAKRVAAEVPAIIAPLIPIGMSQSLSTHPGTLWVDRTALYAYVSGVARSLILNGSRRILFLNGHAGNVQTVADVCAALEAEFRAEDVRCAQIDGGGLSSRSSRHRGGGDFAARPCERVRHERDARDRSGGRQSRRLHVPPAGKDEYPDFIKPRSRFPLGPTPGWSAMRAPAPSRRAKRRCAGRLRASSSFSGARIRRIRVKVADEVQGWGMRRNSVFTMRGQRTHENRGLRYRSNRRLHRRQARPCGA